MTIPVTVNHSGPYEFMVDTGTQLTIVDPSLAADLHLQPQGTIGVLSVAKWTDQQWVMPESIEAGPYAVHKPVAVVESLEQIQSRDPKVRGILGENFLAHFDLLIDHARKILCFDESRQMQQQVQGEHVPVIDQSDHQGPMPLPQLVRISVRLCGGASRDKIMRLDSGAGVAMLYDNHAAIRPQDPRNHASRGHVIGGGAQYFTVLPPQDVRIGKHLLSQVAFMAPLSAGPNSTPAGEDGLLPTGLFDRVFISFADHYVVLNPR